MFYIICTDNKESKDFIVRNIDEFGNIRWFRSDIEEDLGIGFNNIFQAKGIVNQERINDGLHSSHFSYKIVQKEE